MTAEQRRKHGRQLLTKFLAGEQEAFAAFYELHYARLLRFGLTVSPEREEVRDQLQDLFVWAYENGARLRQTNDPEIYLLAALRNRIRKRLGRRRLFATADEELRPLVNSEPAFTEAIHAAETEKERTLLLNRQLAKLPARQQQVIYLRFFEGKSYEDIAVIMHTNVQVARNFVYRGLQKLRASQGDLRQAMVLFFGFEWIC